MQTTFTLLHAEQSLSCPIIFTLTFSPHWRHSTSEGMNHTFVSPCLGPVCGS